MSEQVKPQILLLDPDYDFLDAMAKEAKSRDVTLISQPYSRREAVNIEELVLQHYPDIVLINLDQTDETHFSDPISEIFRTPIPLPPIVMGMTNKDSLALKTQSYRSGIDDYLLRPLTAQEVWFRIDVLLKTRRLQKQLDSATRKLSSLNQQLNSSNRQLEELTLTDELTGLNNMRFVTQYLEKQFHVFVRNQRAFAIMMIDLDHFKEVNDQNDHLVGSETIKAIGHIIQACTRAADVKARYGGDEYIVAMPETEVTGAMKVAERIRKSVEAYDIIGNDNKIFKVTTSIGLGVFDFKRHPSFKDLIREADYSLYLAKTNGRNQTVVFDPSKMSVNEKGGYDESQSGVLGEFKKLKS